MIIECNPHFIKFLIYIFYRKATRKIHQNQRILVKTNGKGEANEDIVLSQLTAISLLKQIRKIKKLTNNYLMN